MKVEKEVKARKGKKGRIFDQVSVDGDRKEVRNFIEVDGTIIDCNTYFGSSNSNPTRRLVVEYMDGYGNKYCIKEWIKYKRVTRKFKSFIIVSSNSYFTINESTIGEKLKVLYDKNNPERAVIKDNVKRSEVVAYESLKEISKNLSPLAMIGILIYMASISFAILLLVGIIIALIIVIIKIY